MNRKHQHQKDHTQLVIPVYINEKTVLDMLAIIEDGFSVVSQIDYTESRGVLKKKRALLKI